MRVNDSVYTYDLDWPLAAELGVDRRGVDGNPLSINVVQTPEATVQIGAGHETTADQAVDVARDHGVDVVVAEHGDPDHYGAAPRLRDELGVEVAIPAGDAEAIIKDGVDPDYRLRGGETFRGVDVIAAAGHTPGNLVFLYDDVLFAGDTLLGADVELVADDDWQGAFAMSPPNRNAGGDQQARETIRRLLDHDFDVVLITHGENVLENAHDEVETLVADLDRGIERADRGVLE